MSLRTAALAFAALLPAWPVHAAPKKIKPAAAAAAQDAAASRSGDVFKLREPAHVDKGETVDGNVVVLGSPAMIEGHVTQDVVVLGGQAYVTGKVDGDVVVIGPSASLGGQSEVGRDFVAIGSMVRREPGSKVRGRTVTLHGLRILAALASVASLIGFAVMWLKLFSVVGWLLLAAIVAALLGGPLGESAAQLRRRPFASFLLGVAFWPAAAFAFAALVVSILGLPLTPLLALLAAAACLWGYLAAGQWLGQAILPKAQTAWLPCFAGVGVLQIAAWLPFGGFLNSAALLVGLGATLLWAAGRLSPFKASYS